MKRAVSSEISALLTSAPWTADMFDPLINEPVWGVRRTHGSLLMMEFGEPHREVRQPKPVADNASERVRRSLARRRVHLVGAWTLEVLFAHWEARTKDAGDATDKSEPERISEVLAEFDGQALIKVREGQTSGSTVFEFDLGASITIRPTSELDAASDQWCLHAYQGPITARRNDGVLVVHTRPANNEKTPRDDVVPEGRVVALEGGAELNVHDLFAPLRGHLAWGIHRSYGTCLAMEFGEPHREIREPCASPSASSERGRRLLTRRRVQIVGDWCLAVLHAHWEIRTEQAAATSFESEPAQVDKALAELDGQALTDVRDGRAPGSYSFHFDLGGSLTIWPSSEAEEDQWRLCQFRGSLAALRNDGALVVQAKPVSKE